MASLKEEQLCSYRLSYGVESEAPNRNVRALLNRDVPVVDLSSSSSSGSETSVANGDAGEVSSIARSPGVKHRLISNGVLNCAGKRPKLEPIQQLGTGIDGYDDMALRPVGASIIPELPLGFLEPLHPTSNGAADTELPADFLEPLPSDRGFAIDMPPLACISPVITTSSNGSLRIKGPSCRQFWKAGDYEGDLAMQKPVAGGMDHVRVHPKFLHSNATSHKWALGAIAELLDNALDEVVNGASFVNLDMIKNPKDGSAMLLIEDDGGGMNPDRMRQCMSLGYSAKSKSANTIGQYGNGFKTSTMRLGADVIVFSRSPARDGCSPTESIGMLSYSFLRDTGQEDIIVPMIDYAIEPYGLRKIIRSNVDDWNRNMETIKHWSPYSTEADLLNQFKEMKTQGTRIVVYNLWEDDQGQFELDFDADKFDIQVRGANRDEKKISMAEKFPNSRHYLTYRHSLRSYVSILYLRLPAGFKIIMRGKVVEHHSLVDDLMFTQELTYKPQGGPEQAQKDNNQMMAVVTIGFVKDAKEHIDVQGFNVYHKNRLIKPFWRIWNSPSSMGRGVIGVLEANFVEPAHDKQGFERTTVLARLEARLLQMQKTYWGNHCHKVGYVSGSVKKGGNASPKVYSSKDSLAAQRVPGLPAPQHISGEAEVHSPGLPVSVLRSARTQMLRIPARVYNNDTFTGSMMTSEPNTVENPHSMHHAIVDDAATRGCNQQHSSTTLINKADCVQQQKDPSLKERSLVDLGRMLTKNILTTEGLQCNVNQVGIMDNCSHSEHLSEEGEILTQGQEEESLHRDGPLNSDTLSSLQAEIERNKQLEAKIIDMEQKIQLLRRSHDKLEREKEFLNERLHEDRKQRALEDEELRKKLKEALMRVKELEAENTRLQLG